MRRAYREVTTKTAETGHRILLDGKALRTPAKLTLDLPTRALAEAIADEWRQQDQNVKPHTMPLMRLAATAVDRLQSKRDAAVAEVAGYAGTDLLCYRAPEPPELARRQHEAWQPILDWLEHRYDASLAVTVGIRWVPQSPVALQRLRAAVAALDDLALIGVHAMTTGMGSLVLALAVLECEISAEAAFAASQLDEDFQVARWGEDAEAARRREGLRRDVLAAARFISLSKA
ncbi:MAG TPA: ATP12 family protein [Candidatus Cybelea sp.]|nr:ATP12 family protein [Candidatus Cybelea sp.]